MADGALRCYDASKLALFSIRKNHLRRKDSTCDSRGTCWFPGNELEDVIGLREEREMIDANIAPN